MKMSNVTEILDHALQVSGFDQTNVAHKLRLLLDSESSYGSGELAEWLGDKKMGHVGGCAVLPANSRQDRTIAPDLENPDPAGKPLLPGRP